MNQVYKYFSSSRCKIITWHYGLDKNKNMEKTQSTILINKYSSTKLREFFPQNFDLLLLQVVWIF